jgi:hypothetical protein
VRDLLFTLASPEVWKALGLEAGTEANQALALAVVVAYCVSYFDVRSLAFASLKAGTKTAQA